MATTITLEDEIDISRGDMIVKSTDIPKVSNHLSAMVVWMDETPLALNQNYIIKRATSVINGAFNSVEFKKNINTFDEISADTLELNDIAKVTLSLDREIAVDSYHENRYTGSFIIIDKYTNSTVGAGMIVSSVDGFARLEEEKKVYTQAETELNAFIRKNYPEWNCKAI
jgi:sulfate adenylyltransferase subunit 1